MRAVITKHMAIPVFSGVIDRDVQCIARVCTSTMRAHAHTHVL
jgi:hypothetical protein